MAAVSEASASAGADTEAEAGMAAPSNVETDKLAAALPADRRGWDGSPLNDADRRLYALREAGYSGPIDQDGYPVTSGEAYDTLMRMGEQTQRRLNEEVRDARERQS